MGAPSPSSRHVLRRALGGHSRTGADGDGARHASAQPPNKSLMRRPPAFATQESIVYAHPCLRARKNTALSTVRAMTDRVGGLTTGRTQASPGPRDAASYPPRPAGVATPVGHLFDTKCRKTIAIYHFSRNKGCAQGHPYGMP